ncbi:MAG: T9SS type A sorting domain-containing protein [bacterium]|nr:T9SS type A sorting domain-containing protein [bacterium]
MTSWTGSHSIFTHIVSSDTFLVYRNNGLLVNRDDANPSFTGHTAYNFYLGKNGSSGNFQGDIAEIIMFSRDVNIAQSNIVNNYLAAKYNLDITNDFYNFEVSHGVEVAGIGQYDENNQHVAARAGIVTISNADDLDDGEYVLFGHDNGDISSWSASEVPATGILRTEREWRFDNTGAPGTISIAISSDLLPALPVGNEDYVIMLDADGDFSNGATVINTVLVDGQYKASNLSISSGDYVTFGVATRTVSFNPTTLSGSETVAASATIVLSLESSEDITLDYAITDGSATGNNDDYALATNGQVTFIAGQTTANLSLGIINDSEIESDETIEITLSNPPSGVSLVDAVFTYTINDDDNGRNVQFNTASSSGDESVTDISLQVDLNLVDPTNDTKVYYSITGGTAELTPSPDYTFTADTLTILATQTSGTIDFSILDDVLSEATETIEISLSSPTNANLGTNVTHTYSITDNDGQVTVEFQDASTTIDEGGSIAELVVELSTISGQDVTVDYNVTEVTATGSGVDFSLANGTLTIPAGSQLETINVALTDDGIEESAETFTVTLSNEMGATLGSATVHTVTISDNDAAFGFYGPGGVGDAESNMLWLDATAVNGRGVTNATDGASVNTWVDNSGNGYDFTAIGSAPTFDEDALNLKNTVIISGTNQGFQAPTGFSNALSNYTFVSVLSQSSGDYLVETNTAARAEFRLSQGANGLYSINNTDYLPSQSTNTDLTTWRFDSENTPSAEIFRNGSALLSDNNFQVMAIDNNFALGSRNSDQAQSASDFAGNISEFIVYRNVINDAQRVIIENYLANKFDLTIPNDYYAYEGTYGFDIVGIGRTNDEQHLQSMSDSLLMISGASDLQNDEFVFSGHDNGNDLAWTTSEAPSGGSNVRRLAREWRTDITGSPGTIIVMVDTTQLPTPPVGYDQYVIYTDDDGDFRSGTTAYQLEYSSVFGFHVTDEVTITDGTYITIGVGQPVIQFSLTSGSGDENVTNPSINVSLNFTLGEDATVNYAATGGTALGGNVDYLLESGTLTIADGQTSANISLGIIDDNTEESDETIEITLTTPSSNVALGSNTVFTYTIHDDDNAEARTVEFATAGPGSGDEATPSVTSVNVNLNTPDDDVITTVDLHVVSSGANAADETDDFVLSTSTISFPADNTTVTQSFDITVVDDAIFEGTEQVTIRLTNPINADLGTVTEYTLDITDNDTQPDAGFTAASSFVNEGAGIASMEVSLSEVSVNDVTVNYTVTGTATSGADYTLTNGSVLILAGDLTEDIQAVIVNDLITEAAENITVTLSGATNATVGGTIAHTLTILDNDQSGSTGPGGVGDASSNIVWLRGDNFSPGTWSDISGNSNNFTGAGPAAGGTGINGQSTVEFDGSQSMTIATGLNSGVSDYDIFFVADADVVTDQVLFNDADGILLGMENSNGGFQDADATWKGDEISTGSSAPSIIQYNLESGSGLAAISLNGTEDVPSVSFDYTATTIGGTSTLGALSGGGSGFDGEIGEFLIYNSPLNAAQRLIVTNYLATRYNISVASDLFAYDDGTPSSSYYYDLIGIGQEDATNLHVSATSENFLTIANPNNLDDSEYLLLANDGADMTSWTFAGTPANGSTRKVAKEWRVDKTGDLGTISFQVDTTALPTPPSTGLTWALIVTTDGDFTDIDATYPLTSVSGDIVGIDGLNFTDGDIFSLALIEYQSTGVSNDFSNPLAWTTGVVPTTGTNVNIVDGHTLFLSQNVDVGSITMEGTGTLSLAGFTMELTEGCITMNGSGTIDVSTTGSTIGYTNPNVTEQCVTGMTYNNLYTDGPTGSTKYLTGDITVEGNLELQSSGGTGAIFDSRDFGTTDDYSITIQGNWISEIDFLPRTGTVTFNGTSGQSIDTDGGETFHNLTINKVGTTNRADSTLTLGSNLSTSGLLTMTSGYVDLGIFDVTVEDGSSIVGGDNMSYLIVDGVGVLRHAITAFSTAYAFPIGDEDEYAPFEFTLSSGTLSNSSVTINMRDAKHTNIVEDNFITRYWTLENENIGAPFEYGVSFDYTDVDVEGVENLLLCRKFSTSGDDLGGSVNIGSNTLAATGYTSFSDLTGESQPATLPVTLISFEAKSMEEGGVRLDWATATELNNDYFEVLKSYDGEDYESIGIVQGNGTTNLPMEYQLIDNNPLYGNNYYALRQVDFDGTEEIVGITYVNYLINREEMSTRVYPNPTNSDNLNVTISSGDIETPIFMKIVNLEGKLIYEETVSGSPNYDIHIDAAQEMVSGMYILMVNQGDTVKYERIVIR